MNKGKLVHFLAATVLMTSLGLSASIGTAPGVQDLGVIDKGETNEYRFYITTRGIDTPFLVNPEFNRESASMLEGRFDSSFESDSISQQDKMEWIDFYQDTYEVDPSERNIVSLEDGGTVVYNQEIEFTVSVPEDAESGYHMGTVDLNPEMDRRGVGASSVLNLGLTKYIFYFRVPGHAERDLNIMDVRAVRTGGEEARFDFIVRNNGTVTSWVRTARTEIFDREGVETGELTTGGQYIAPGESRVISTTWNNDQVEGGEYRVRGEMDYITGNSFVDETVSISDMVQVERESEEEGYSTLWLVLIGLVILGVMMFSFKVDPIHIMAVLGAGGISWFIYWMGLPNYLIGVLITVTVALIVYEEFL